MKRALIPLLFWGKKKTAVPWYLAGGVDAANCVAAYQAIGAADYAASKVNLVAAGTHDAADGTAAPTWDAADGWTFNGLTQYLATDIVPVINPNTWSVLVRYSAYSAGTWRNLFGVNSPAPGATSFGIVMYTGGAYYYNGNYQTTASPAASGVIGFGGSKCYFNGSDLGKTILSGGTITKGILIGAVADGDTGAAGSFLPVKIQAMAIYNATITVAQALAITTAMANLT